MLFYKDESPYLLTISAKADAALNELVSRYQEYLYNKKEVPLVNIAYSTNLFSAHFKKRIAILANNTDEAINKIQNKDYKKFVDSSANSLDIAFVFTGVEAGYPGMGKILYERNLFFQNALNECYKIISRQLNINLFDNSFVEIASQSYSINAHFSLFAVEYSLAQLWLHLGINPQYVVGFGVGEFAAAVTAGLITFSDGVDLVKHYAKLVHYARDDYENDFNAEFEKFMRVIKQAKYTEPKMAILSGCTSEKISDETLVDIQYWLKHFKHSAGIEEAISTLANNNIKLFIEVSPEPLLSPSILNLLNDNNIHCLSTLKIEHYDWAIILESLAELYVRGKSIIWQNVYENKYSKIALPKYPFQPYTYWPIAQENLKDETDNLLRRTAESDIKEQDIFRQSLFNDIEESGFFAPVWLETSVEVKIIYKTSDVVFIYFFEDKDIVDKYINYNNINGFHVVISEKKEDILDDIVKFSENIVDLFSMHYKKFIGIDEIYFFFVNPVYRLLLCDNIKFLLNSSIGLLLQLLKYLNNNNFIESLKKFNIITSNAFRVLPNDQVFPYSTSLISFGTYLSKEYPDLQIQCLDINLNNSNQEADQKNFYEFIYLLSQQRNTHNLNLNAIRNNVCYIRRFYSAKIFEGSKQNLKLRYKGVYLICGGASGIGFELSKQICKYFQANLILVGRTKYNKEIANKINELASLGGSAIYKEVDITSQADIDQLVIFIKQRFGYINGIVHSAITVRQCLVADLKLEDFYDELVTGIDGSLLLANIAIRENLDFLILFSSISSIMGGIRGNLGYVINSAFKDGFAYYFDERLRNKVKVINWGYWNIGVGSNHNLGKLFNGLGIKTIESNIAFKVLQNILNGSIVQGLCINAENETLLEYNILPAHIYIYPQEIPFASKLQFQKDINEKGKELTKYVEGYEKLECYAKLLLIKFLYENKFFDYLKENNSITKIINKLNIVEKYRPFFQGLLNILSHEKIISMDSDRINFLMNIESLAGSLVVLQNLDKEIEFTFPKIKAYLRLLNICLKHYLPLLTGNILPTEVFFPNASFELVMGIYNNNPIADYFNKIVASIIKCYIRDIGKFVTNIDKINILEIGAGVGGTSESIVHAIDDYKGSVNYVISDISEAFLNCCKEKFSAYSDFIKFQLLDLDKSSLAQGFHLNSFHVIVATNVLHATKSLDIAIDNIKLLLKTNGIFILNESATESYYAKLTFALFEGWWYRQEAKNDFYKGPLLNLDGWVNLLQSKGFYNLQNFIHDKLNITSYAQQVIIAVSDGVLEKVNMREISVKEVNANCTTNTLDITNNIKNKINMASIKQIILKSLVGVLKINLDEYEFDSDFKEIGLDSILAIELADKLTNYFSKKLNVNDIYKYNTGEKLAQYLSNNTQFDNFSIESPESKSQNDNFVNSQLLKIKKGFNPSNTEGIAIIGVSVRYPGVNNLTAFWEKIISEKEIISSVFWDQGENDKEIFKKTKCKVAFLENSNEFDSLFFNISPREAAGMDPQERVMLELAWSVLEDAGYTPETIRKYHNNIGVFIGVTTSSHDLAMLETDKFSNSINYSASFSSISNRISHFFNFTGPSLAVDTMCASSLTALHLACQSLLAGEIELALVGGVNIYSHPAKVLNMEKLGFLSTDSRTLSFDIRGTGFIPAEGAGMILLKRASLMAKQDNSYGLVKASIIKHGGKSDYYRLSNKEGQINAIKELFNKANISPETIGYIEAQATGSFLTDSIELYVLSKAFQIENKIKLQSCPIGSIKPNFGHSESAAGITQLIKVLLQMKYQQLVPTIIRDKDKLISMDQTPFYLQTQLTEWKRLTLISENKEFIVPRRALISSFGAGGSIANILVEESQIDHLGSDNDDSYYVVAISAKRKELLYDYVRAINTWLREAIYRPNMADISFTLNVGRVHFKYRCAFIINSLQKLLVAMDTYLNEVDPKNIICSNCENEDSQYTDNLIQLSRTYVNGSDIDWKALYINKNCKRISLPTYPFKGDHYSIKTFLGTETTLSKQKNDAEISIGEEEKFDEVFVDYLRKMLARVIGLDYSNFDVNESLSNYGFDSIVMIDIKRRLEKIIPDISLEDFYEKHTLKTIAITLFRNYRGHIEKFIMSQLNNATFIKEQKEFSLLSQQEQIKKQFFTLDSSYFYKSRYKNYPCTKYSLLELYIDRNNSLWIFLNNSPANLMSMEMLSELYSILLNINKFIKKPKIIYITHNGHYFSLGGDRKYILECLVKKDEKAIKKYWQMCRKVMSKIYAFPGLYIGVAGATAQGGGFEMLIGTDFQFVAQQIKLGLPEIKSGLYAGMGGVSYLCHRLGELRARQLNISGNLITSEQAKEWGLISHIADNPFQEALNFFDEIPDIDIAIHINSIIRQKKKKIIMSNLKDWLSFVLLKSDNIKKNIIMEDYSVFSVYNHEIEF